METPGITENPMKFLEFFKKITSDPDIAPLIDPIKIVRLRKYEAALNAAIQHYKQYGDHTLIPRLLLPLKQSIYYIPVLTYVCDQASVTFSIVDGEIKLKKKESIEGSGTSKRTLEQYLDSPQKVICEETPQPPMPIKRTAGQAGDKQKKEKKKPYIDMLDSWARLPGSFEGGRRR